MDKLICRGKDANPVDTINKIKNILSDININVNHFFVETGVENCFSSHVFIEGKLKDFIGTNGKGTTEEFCLASGYAELMERVQNNMFFYGIHYLDQDTIDEIDKIMITPQYKNWDELLEDEDSYFNKLVDQCAKTMLNTPVWLRKQTAVEQFKITFSQLNDKILTMPFYHVNKKRYQWFPEAVAKFFVWSNGMAAGNTLEEALVQGYSEVYERESQRDIMVNKLTPPRLPDYVIERYPYVKKVIKDIEKSGPYKVIVCDCSLGRNLPVVCGILIDTINHTFGIKFGAHPNMGIALERVFTESLQGKKLEQFTKYNSTIFSATQENNIKNILNSMKVGSGYYPASIFGSKPSYEFSEWDWDGNGENKELAYKMSKKLQEDGFDIYVKDASFLGFPSVFIIVPGLSELCPCTMLYLKELRLKFNVLDNLLHINQIDERKVEQIIRYSKTIRNAAFENTINTMYALPLNKKMHGGRSEINFLVAACYYYLGNVPEAYNYMHMCRSLLSYTEEDYEYVSLAEKMLQGIMNGYELEVIKDFLKSVSNEMTYNKIMNDFSNPKEILNKLYPHFDNFTDLKSQDENSSYYALSEFFKKVFKAQTDNNVMMKHLHIIFEDYLQDELKN